MPLVCHFWVLLLPNKGSSKGFFYLSMFSCSRLLQSDCSSQIAILFKGVTSQTKVGNHWLRLTVCMVKGGKGLITLKYCVLKSILKDHSLKFSLRKLETLKIRSVIQNIISYIPHRILKIEISNTSQPMKAAHPC